MSFYLYIEILCAKISSVFKPVGPCHMKHFYTQYCDIEIKRILGNFWQEVSIDIPSHGHCSVNQCCGCNIIISISSFITLNKTIFCSSDLNANKFYFTELPEVTFCLSINEKFSFLTWTLDKQWESSPGKLFWVWLVYWSTNYMTNVQTITFIRSSLHHYIILCQVLWHTKVHVTKDIFAHNIVIKR